MIKPGCFAVILYVTVPEDCDPRLAPMSEWDWSALLKMDAEYQSDYRINEDTDLRVLLTAHGAEDL